MLDVTRFQTGSLILEPTKVCLSELVHKVLGHFSKQLRSANCHIALNIPSDISGQWDQSRLLQVLINIVDNAIKYAPDSTLSINAAQSTDKTIMIIKDTGPGIPKDKQPLIFNRFERLGANINVSGLGLGLYICKKIIEAQGGTIELDSNINEGTSFTIELANKI